MADRGVSPGRSHLLKTVTALDGTRKFLLRLHDDRVVEAVGIPSEEQGKSRLTVCVSSQVGMLPTMQKYKLNIGPQAAGAIAGTYGSSSHYWRI